MRNNVEKKSNISSYVKNLCLLFLLVLVGTLVLSGCSFLESIGVNTDDLGLDELEKLFYVDLDEEPGDLTKDLLVTQEPENKLDDANKSDETSTDEKKSDEASIAEVTSVPKTEIEDEATGEEKSEVESTPLPSPTQVPTATSTPTEEVKPTNTAKPTATKEVTKPTATSTAVPTQKATPTPKPTATPTPTKKPVATPTPTRNLGESDIWYYANTNDFTTKYLTGDFATVYSEEEFLNEFYKNCKDSAMASFGIMVENYTIAKTPKELVEIFPGLETCSIEMNQTGQYDNGYYFRYFVTCKVDFELKTAILTNDSSRLSEVDLEVLDKLYWICDNYTDSTMNDFERVRAIHDYLVLNIAYATEELSKPEDKRNDRIYEPEGAVLDGYCVCDGYSKSFDLLCLILGIESGRVTGETLPNYENHAWNVVKIDGYWYQIDCTWDDPTPDVEGRVDYTYFLVPDSMMYNHGWVHDIICDNDDYAFVMYDGKFDYSDELFAFIDEEIENKVSEFTVAYYYELGSDAAVNYIAHSGKYYGRFTYSKNYKGEYLVVKVILDFED